MDESILDPAVVSSYTSNGAMFEHFSLFLPNNTKIERINVGEIKFKSSKLEIIIIINYDGTANSLPQGFEKYYLQLDEKYRELIDIKKVNLTIKVEFKYGLFLSGKRLEYYDWLDIFLDYIDNKFSDKAFFNRIGWESTLTTIQLLEKKNQNKKVD